MKAKITFEYDSEDQFEKAEANRIMKATSAYSALHDIAESIFRPARKHGYNSPVLEELLNSSDGKCEDVIGELEELFYEILRDRGIDLDDLP